MLPAPPNPSLEGQDGHRQPPAHTLIPRVLPAGRRHTTSTAGSSFTWPSLQSSQDSCRGPLASVLLPSVQLELQHPGGRGAAALAPGQGWLQAVPSCQAPRAAWAVVTKQHHHCCRQQRAGPWPGRRQLGLREAQSLHCTAQALAHSTNGQQTVPDHDAGAGAAWGGHGGEALPLVLLGVEGLCRVQDRWLVS